MADLVQIVNHNSKILIKTRNFCFPWRWNFAPAHKAAGARYEAPKSSKPKHLWWQWYCKICYDESEKKSVKCFKCNRPFLCLLRQWTPSLWKKKKKKRFSCISDQLFVFGIFFPHIFFCWHQKPHQKRDVFALRAANLLGLDAAGYCRQDLSENVTPTPEAIKKPKKNWKIPNHKRNSAKIISSPHIPSCNIPSGHKFMDTEKCLTLLQNWSRMRKNDFCMTHAESPISFFMCHRNYHAAERKKKKNKKKNKKKHSWTKRKREEDNLIIEGGQLVDKKYLLCLGFQIK